jgi:molybdenum cofactor cytidylyltransferase
VTAALVLAAGGSTRLGRPKQLEPWGDTTLLGCVLQQVRAAGFPEIYVVLGHAVERVLAAVDFEGCTVIENPEWEEGLASSLRAGLDAISRLSRAETVAIFLGDQPDIDVEVVEKLRHAISRSRRLAVVPKYRYLWGNPVFVKRPLWERLMSLEGDEGAKRLLQAHPEWVEEVWFEERSPRDVDTESDIAEMRPRH